MRGEPTQNSNSSRFGWVRPEERLARWGLRQHRQVTTRQLRAVGWDSNDVAYRVRQGRLHPAFTEVYSLGGPPRTEREWWMAAVLTFGPGTRLSDVAAAELYGWLRYPAGEIHVTTATEHRRRAGIVPLLDCAATLRSGTLFRRIVRQAQAEKTTTHGRLLILCARSASLRGVARLRAELADGPSPTRSADEDRVLDLLRHAGPILPNHDIGGDEVDLYLPDHNAVIEVQSALHDNPAARKHDEAKQRRLEARGLRVYWMS